MRTILVLLFFTFIEARSQNLTSGLQACYPLNNSAQNAAITGPALNGILSNVTPTLGHTGTPNAAYHFLGSTNSYIELPDHPGLKNNSLFFSGWFLIDSLPNVGDPQYLVYTSNGCTSDFEAVSLHTYYNNSIGDYVFCVTKSGSNCFSKLQIISNIPPALGNWYHVCYFIDNTVMKLYVNGVLQSTLSHSVPFGYQPGLKVYLGVTNQVFFDFPFKGSIDDVRFYNRELSQSEVTQLYTQHPACSELSAPVTSFIKSKEKVCIGQTINFTDQSTNSPTTWNWTFAGGTPSASSVKNPTVTFPVAGTYTVTLIASNAQGAGNKVSQTVTVSLCTALTESEALSDPVRVYPNPTTDHLVVKHLEAQTFVICDIVGKQVEYKSTFISENTQEIQLLTAAPGLYFVKVFNAQGICVQKIKVVIASN